MMSIERVNSNEEQFRYLAIKPTASISTLRQKMWHILDLPDYCEEIIVLKNNDKLKIPLTELRKGNEPHRPFILEVWLPGRQRQSATSNNNMLMGLITSAEENQPPKMSTEVLPERSDCINTNLDKGQDSLTRMTTEAMVFNKFAPLERKRAGPRFSNTSFFIKTQSRNSTDNFTKTLFKIQSDLTSLHNKLSYLETKLTQ
ncbi:uncharacterized protein LOC113229564 isoform X2 [Hyposmocoma kahamanoa]|uniref:uncharacterized protein LOC113229564 isoform X2 n=1 Tax=Hyposmocoma kahamanoa TaxID=1477025 RepID=UPI000E6D7E4B|nr:uncharacterized protein LOC113229564 isoform X2 [Hyposmocoma kahamanoa]